MLSKAYLAKEEKKAPGAPRRFKSAYIWFSTEEHKKIRKEFAARGEACTTPQVAKLVSKAWKSISDTERAHWDTLAAQDKARFAIEMASYKGPLKITKSLHRKKDPNAPRRPVTVFLQFCNDFRDQVREENPNCSPVQVTSILSRMWKEAPAYEKKFYKEQSAQRLVQYKIDLEAYKKEKDKDRQEREKQAVAEATRDGLWPNIAFKKKSPKAPLPFKSSFLLFSDAEHKKIHNEFAARGEECPPPLIANFVTKAWDSLSATKRARWDKLAARDKSRYEIEMAYYQGPLLKLVNDSNAPKQPLSSFAAFCKNEKDMVKKEYPGRSDDEYKSILIHRWNDKPKDEKQLYIEQATELHNQYKKDLESYKKAKYKDRIERENRVVEEAVRKGHFPMQSYIAESAIEQDQKKKCVKFSCQETSQKQQEWHVKDHEASEIDKEICLYESDDDEDLRPIPLFPIEGLGKKAIILFKDVEDTEVNKEIEQDIDMDETDDEMDLRPIPLFPLKSIKSKGKKTIISSGYDYYKK